MSKGTYKRTEKHKQITSEGLKRFYQNGGISGNKGKHFKHTEMTKRKMKEAKQLFYRNGGVSGFQKGSENPSFGGLSDKHKQKVKESLKVFYMNGGVAGMKNKHHTETYKQRRKEWAINHPNRKFSGTKIELKMRTELDQRGFQKNTDYFCNVGLDKIANVDIFLPALKVVIECDGCFRHACPLHGNLKYHQDVSEKDTKKTNLLEKAGYKVYRFWEHEINESAERCLNKIFKNKNL